MISNEVAHLRADAGLSLRAAARAIGVSAPAVQGWERGTFAPSPRNLRRIEAAFGLKRGTLDNEKGGVR